MSELFLKILNMSISATWVVLAVVVLRLILKKAPKWVNVLLWGMVAVRLICPISLESVFSLIPSAQTLPEEVISGPSFEVQTGVAIVDNPVNNYLDVRYFEGVTVPANNGFHVMTVLSVIWMLGMAGMLAYTLISYLRLHRKVETAVLLRENIFQSEAVGSPFVLGIVKPRIYLPFQIEATNLEHVVAHEQAHICRRDHWWKPLGFLLLTIHWFNPLLWLAYVLLCRDIELACDEKVIKNLNNDEKADYSQALLACSIGNGIHRRMISACPLAFGEVGVKERVKSVLNYKKPGFWVMVLAVVACAVVAVCFLTNPKEKLLHAPEPFCHSYRVSEVLYSDPQISYNYGEHAPRYQFTSDYAMFETENVLTDGEIVDGWAQRQGAFKEFKVTYENFEYYFVADGGEDRSDWSKFRKSVDKSWKLDTETNGKSLFFYLIYTKEKEVYLAIGGNVGDEAVTGLKTRISWIFKLERTDVLTVNAVSEGCDAYIEPAYYPEVFDFNDVSFSSISSVYPAEERKLPSGTINQSGKLVFHTSLDVDTLTVYELYFGKSDILQSAADVERKTYELEPVSKGAFELSVALRGTQTEEAVYTIEANEGKYVFKIVFGADSAELVTSSGKITKWFDYTENPADMDYEKELTTTHPDFPGVTFHYTPYDISVTEKAGIFGRAEKKKLIEGWPIWNAYFYDVTGDGISDICASLSIGFGAIDERVIVYDYANSVSYSLENRMEYDYYLRYNKEDALLYVDKKVYNSNELVESGPLVFQNECIQILWETEVNADKMLTALKNYYKDELPDSASSPHVLFADTNNGMIMFGVGETTLIYVTKDGGITWEQTEIPEVGKNFHAWANCATAISAAEYCIGYRYWGDYDGTNFYLTKDSGKTWTRLAPETAIPEEITSDMRYAEAADVYYENGCLVVQVSCKTESGNPWSVEVKLVSEDLGETWKMIRSWGQRDDGTPIE